jgi:hypothetical protein
MLDIPSRSGTPARRGLLALLVAAHSLTPTVAAQDLSGAAADPLGDAFPTSGPVVDLTQLTTDLDQERLLVQLAFVGAAGSGRPLGYIDIDADLAAGTGGLPWAEAEGWPRSSGLGMDLYLDLFSYRDDDRAVGLFNEAGELLARLPAAFSETSLEVAVPRAHLGNQGRVGVAAVVGSTQESTDVVPNAGAVVAKDATIAIPLQGDRFEVSVTWRTGAGDTGVGHLATRSEDSAILYFFGPENWEMLVKVLDGCAVNGAYWVFFAATTDVEFSLTVSDLQAQQTKTYTNPLGSLAHTVADTSAFKTCPQ